MAPTATTTTNTATAGQPTATPPPPLPSDEQILVQLANLQSLHAKIFQLRSLLPERLMDPVKAAVEASSLRSGYEAPTALAARLRSVALDGDRHVREFEEQWRSEAMREVRGRSREGVFPQGSDVWGADYCGLVGVDVKHGGGTGGEGKAEAASDEDVEKVFERFEAEISKVKLERREGGADLTTAGQTLTITRSEGVGDVLAREWLVTAKAGTTVTERLREVLRCFETRPNKKSLAFVLDMIASYKDLKTRPCETCKNIFDDNLRLPNLRLAHSKPEGGSHHFLAYHVGCV